MIISTAAAFDSLSPDELRKFDVCFENLLLAHKSGWHCFVPSRTIIGYLMSSDQLSARQRAFVESEILGKYASLSGAAKDAWVRIEASPINPDGFGTETTIVVPMNAFLDINNCKESRLLVENRDSDGRFLLTLCDVFRAEFRHYAAVRFNLVHGGGVTTDKVLEAFIAEARPTICVVDSDRSTPNCGLGETAEAVERVIKQRLYGTVVVHVLEVRELENLIPLDIADEICSDNPHGLKAIALLRGAIGRLPEEGVVSKSSILKYFDFKDGLARTTIA